MENIVELRIEKEFKSLFKRLLDEGSIQSFEQILERVTHYLEVPCPEQTKQKLVSWHENIAKHSFLKQLVQNHSFEELVFFGKDFITRDGQAQETIHLCEQDFILAWTQLAFNHGMAWNHAHPFVSFAANICDVMTRITLIHPCCSPDGKMRAFVRAHAHHRFQINDFTNDEVADFLKQSVRDKKNIIVIGATQSGKTTLMGSMLEHVDENEHVVILEDTHEIKRQAVRTTPLLADSQDKNRSLSEYCAMALRMSPDRIVLGEIRSKEVVPLLLAFNSGHRGGLTSLHADSVNDGLERLALLFHLYAENAQLPHDKVMDLVCRNIDLAVYVQDKQVLEIAEIKGSEGGRAIYETTWQQDASKTPIIGDLASDSWWKKASTH